MKFVKNKLSVIFGGLLTLLVLPFTASSDETSVSLQKAYEREFAFLAAQSKILKERLQELDNKFSADEKEAQAEISTLEDRLLVAKSKSEKRSASVKHVTM